MAVDLTPNAASNALLGTGGYQPPQPAAPRQQLAEYLIRGQWQAPNGDTRQLIQPQGEDLAAALKALERLRLFPNPPGLDPNTLKLQGRL